MRISSTIMLKAAQLCSGFPKEGAVSWAPVCCRHQLAPGGCCQVMPGKGGNAAGRGSLHRRASLAAWHSSYFCSHVSCFLPHVISLNLQRCFLSLHKNSPICFLQGSPGQLPSADTPEEQFPDLTNQCFFLSSLNPRTFSSRKKT